VREDTDPVAWLDAGGGYQLALRGRAVRARNARGRELTTLPPALRGSPLLARLRDLAEWLERHERECAAAVETWMLRSLPVPPKVLAALWPDPAWRAALADAVVSALDPDGEPLPGGTGLLRAADPDRGLGVVTADGETRWLRPAACAVPHPALIPDLEDLRDFATELDVEQRVAQLFRETWALPAGADDGATAVHAFAGGRFDPARRALSRCRELGYQVSDVYAVTRVWEGGRLFEARYLVGDGHPDYDTVTGELFWVGAASRRLPLREVGRVAFSEGMRMAAAIFGGRTADGLEAG
jgi:hypothetical protein